jgi:hypothetical protein
LFIGSTPNPGALFLRDLLRFAPIVECATQFPFVLLFPISTQELSRLLTTLETVSRILAIDTFIRTAAAVFG